MKEKKARKLRKKMIKSVVNDDKFLKKARIMFGMKDYKTKEVRKEVKKMIKGYIKKRFDHTEGDNIIDRRKKEREIAANAESKAN